MIFDKNHLMQNAMCLYVVSASIYICMRLFVRAHVCGYTLEAIMNYSNETKPQYLVNQVILLSSFL